MENKIYIVYVEADEKNRITDVNSSAFLTDLTGWIEIDRGSQIKHFCARWNYFEKPIKNEWGIYNYKLADGKPAERTQAEMDADWEEPVPQPDTVQRIAELEAAMTAIEEGIASV